MVLLRRQAVLVGLYGHKLQFVTVDTQSAAQCTCRRRSHLHKQVTQCLPHNLHVVELRIIHITLHGHIYQYLVVLVFQYVQRRLERYLHFAVHILAAVANLSLENIYLVLVVKVAVGDIEACSEAEDAVLDGVASVGHRPWAQLLHVKPLDGKEEVLIVLYVHYVTFPAHHQVTAARQRGAHLCVVATGSSEVIGSDVQPRHREVEIIGQRKVIIGHCGILNSNPAHMQLHRLRRFLLFRLLHLCLRPIVQAALQRHALLFLLRQ